MAASLTAYPQVRRTAVAIAITAIVAAVLFSDVEICPFALIVRHPCPGCGMTRSVILAAKGDLRGSLLHHPLAAVIFPIVAVVMTRNLIGWIRHGRWGDGHSSRARWITWLAFVVAIAMFGVWVARFFGAFGGPVKIG